MPEKSLLSRPWLWAHVLSLEAPLVAVLWTAALARLHGAKLPPGVLLGLGLVVWMIYLLDRVLDTFSPDEAELDVRHRFYARHRGWILAVLLPLLAVGVVWVGLWCVPVGLLVEALVLLPAVVVYLVVYTDADARALRRVMLVGAPGALLVLQMLPFPDPTKMAALVLVLALVLLAWWPRLRAVFQRCLRKESAAGVIFALGCTTYARFNQQGGREVLPWIELLLLAFLFTGNVTMLTQQELPAKMRRDPRGFLIGSALLCAWLGYGGFWHQDAPSLHALAALVLAGLLLHLVVWVVVRERSAECFRFWADVALLLPPLWLWCR